MSDTLIAVTIRTHTIAKSRLREPQVTEYAQHELVEIQMGADEENLVMSAKSRWQAQEELNELSMSFLTVTAANRMHGPVPAVLLGDLAFIAEWSTEEKHRFYDGFLEALHESLRTSDPSVARAFLQRMAAPDTPNPNPGIVGKIDGEAAEKAASRFGPRRT